jgi:hypothetical protein
LTGEGIIYSWVDDGFLYTICHFQPCNIFASLVIRLTWRNPAYCLALSARQNG